ncbi:unnamed protein product [Coregonus sp. 'balchen']|nr:unnamed protein product [Coregonus sp. 'balchen']
MATLNVFFVVHLLCIIVLNPVVYAKCSDRKYQIYYLSQTRQTLNDLAMVRDMRLRQNLPIADMVKNYFKQLDDFLSHERFSLCSWEVVRAEIGSILRDFYIKTKMPRKHV